jgi:hypothetical protein
MLFLFLSFLCIHWIKSEQTIIMCMFSFYGQDREGKGERAEKRKEREKKVIWMMNEQCCWQYYNILLTLFFFILSFFRWKNDKINKQFIWFLFISLVLVYYSHHLLYYPMIIWKIYLLIQVKQLHLYVIYQRNIPTNKYVHMSFIIPFFFFFYNKISIINMITSSSHLGNIHNIRLEWHIE